MWKSIIKSFIFIYLKIFFCIIYCHHKWHFINFYQKFINFIKPIYQDSMVGMYVLEIK